MRAFMGHSEGERTLVRTQLDLRRFEFAIDPAEEPSRFDHIVFLERKLLGFAIVGQHGLPALGDHRSLGWRKRRLVCMPCRSREVGHLRLDQCRPTRGRQMACGAFSLEGRRRLILPTVVPTAVRRRFPGHFRYARPDGATTVSPTSRAAFARGPRPQLVGQASRIKDFFLRGLLGSAFFTGVLTNRAHSIRPTR